MTSAEAPVAVPLSASGRQTASASSVVRMRPRSSLRSNQSTFDGDATPGVRR